LKDAHVFDQTLRDFTLAMYRNLLSSLRFQGYAFQTFAGFLQSPKDRVVVLRHDVDRKCARALQKAELEKRLDICASYYFRVVKSSNQPEVIKKIAQLGHEIGYHYEDLTLSNGDFEDAIRSFANNLAYFRKFYPVSTICMHGSPLSKWDNKLLWGKYNYREFDISGEPYFDIDFTKVYYVTDTGRSWNNRSSSIRDKVDSGFAFSIASSMDLIKLAQRGDLPDQLMINTHPERWTDAYAAWFWELIFQRAKNQVKSIVVSMKNS
jgi:hypothetical protein